MPQAISVETDDAVAKARDQDGSRPRHQSGFASQDSFSPDPKSAEGARHATAPYYRVLVDLLDTRLRLLRDRVQLIPGTAELKVGRCGVMSYSLYPLLRGLDESIREY